MLSETKKCKICGTGYIWPEDKQEHASRHTAYLRHARIASRFASYHKKEFISLVNEYMIAEMIGLGENGFPRDEMEKDEPLYIHRNSYTTNERFESMDNLCKKKYATVCWFNNCWLYMLTYKGFEATAAWLQRDLVFTLND